MKSSVLFFLTFLLATCNVRHGNETSSTVETSLAPPVHLVGDSLWTIESRMKHYGVPGVSLAVVRNGKIAWSKAYGVMDEETKQPVTTETLFQAASISKPVSAYAALHIVQTGGLSLDANVNDYLKSWKLPDNEFTATKKVSLKHLLSHTGGVTVHGFLGYSPGLQVPSLVQVLNGEKPANSPAIVVDKEPGGTPRYSGGGYTIAQQLLIDVEGKPYPQLMHDIVLAPLGMEHSSYDQPLPEDKLGSAATGYLPDGTMTKGKRHTYPELAAAGLWTTAEDLAKFAIDIQNTYADKSNKVINQKTVTQMLTPVDGNYQGLGVFLADNAGDVYFSHSGWNEGFSSKFVAHRDKGYGAVVMINRNQPEFIEELIRAVALADHWDHYVETLQSRPVSPAAIKSATGRFINNNSDDVLSIYNKDGKLYYHNTRVADRELAALSDSTFVLRDLTRIIQVSVAPGGKKKLYFIDMYDPSIREAHRELAEGEKVPFEYLMDGHYDEALKGYQQLQKENADDPAINEQNLNELGYGLLNKNDVVHAKDLFRINTELYPKSGNAWDSYAEASLKSGEKNQAINYYRKSLALDPHNENAKTVLKSLTGGK